MGKPGEERSEPNIEGGLGMLILSLSTDWRYGQIHVEMYTSIGSKSLNLRKKAGVKFIDLFL